MMCDNFEDCIFISTLFICYWLQVPVLDAQGGKKKNKKTWNIKSLEQRSLLYGLKGESVVHAHKTLSSAKGFTKAFLKARWEMGVVSCCKLINLVILCCCSCPQRSGQTVPINLQQDKCYSLFCNFLSPYELTFKGQSPENKLSCIFQAVGNILLQKVQSQHD